MSCIPSADDKKTKIVTNAISGIWNSLGCIPTEDKLVYKLEDNSTSGSLINLCGFDREERKIGQLRESYVLSELVVMIPMRKDKIDSNLTWVEGFASNQNKKECGDCDEYTNPCDDSTSTKENAPTKPPVLGMAWNEIERSWLFTISETVIKSILKKDRKQIKITEAKQILEEGIQSGRLNINNNIVKLMVCMTNYNIPPHLNWLAYPNEVLPYAFYVGEFYTTLTKQDLGNIWQGTMPKIAEDPEEQYIEIEHYLTPDEIFGGYDIASIDNIELKIFKCKKRAKHDYYKDVVKSSKKPGMSQETPDPDWYQYNWPYDYFSLVELLKVEGWEARDYKPSEQALSASAAVDPNYKLELEVNPYKAARDKYVAENATYTKSLYE